MDDVVIPQIEPSFDIESEKPDVVKQQELEQSFIEKQLKSEVNNSQFPLLRKELEGYIEKYGDVTVLAGLIESDFAHQAKAHAIVVSELKGLLNVIDQIGGVDEQEVENGDGR